MNLYDVGRKWLNRDVEHYGPVYRRMISPDLCYFTGMFSLSHIKEIEDIEEAKQPMFTSKPELERSGMGFTVMETFMDSMVVESEEGRGTIVTLKKKFAE